MGGVTRYLDIAVRALATADVDQARAFVARELGPLASRDETNRRLAATVRTYLDENGSRGRAARRLNVHENTVAYRLRQPEEILGRSVDKRTLELRVALAVADLVGEAADSNRATPGANYCKPASGGVADLRDCGAVHNPVTGLYGNAPRESVCRISTFGSAAKSRNNTETRRTPDADPAHPGRAVR